MENEEIVRFIEENDLPIVRIPTERRYWLVRTSSGEYYDSFYFENYIAIGWNEFNDFQRFDTVDKSVLITEIDNQYRENKQPGLIYNQIVRFYKEMQIGDIVMIPSQNSSFISFGLITTDAFLQEVNDTEIEEGSCPYIKRRSVEWIKTVNRNTLDPLLYKMMQSHHTINAADNYADAIDRTLYDFYIKNDKVNLIIDVKKRSEISGIDLVDGISNILELAEYVKNPYNTDIEYDKRDIDLKIRVESPGVLHFIALGPEGWAVLGIGILLTFIVGGKITFNHTKEVDRTQTGLEVSSEGLIDKILKFKAGKSVEDLEALEARNKESFEKLEMEAPIELEKLPTPSLEEAGAPPQVKQELEEK